MKIVRDSAVRQEPAQPQAVSPEENRFSIRPRQIALFFLWMLAFTLLARGTSGALLPEVQLSTPAPNTITQSLTATGTIQWAAGSLFYLPEGLLVEAVFVSEGEAVQEGDKIAALRREDVEQKLRSLQAELAQKQTEYARLTKPVAADSYDLEKAQQALQAAYQAGSKKTPQIYETNPPYLTDNICKIRWIFMIIAVCDPKGIAIEAIKTILYHDKGLSDRISRIYEFWNMEQLLDASRDSSFDCIVFPNYCNSHNSVVCSLSCGYNRFPLVEHDPRYTLIVRDILYWETARSLWTQYLKAIPGKEEKVKRAIRGILADYEKEERDIIYLESKNHCVLVHLDGIRQTPEGSPSFYATLDEAEHEFASSAFLRIHKSYLINGDHILQMSNYKVLLDTGMTLKGSRKYFSKAKLEFYRGR